MKVGISLEAGAKIEASINININNNVTTIKYVLTLLYKTTVRIKNNNNFIVMTTIIHKLKLIVLNVHYQIIYKIRVKTLKMETKLKKNLKILQVI